jgi:DNA-binding response OmpR family regulator
MRYYISIEKDTGVFEQYKALWAERGLTGILADDMTDGIEKAVEIEKTKTAELLFIDIVANDIDFMPQLKILSKETNAFILVATSAPNTDERTEALINGADYYGDYCEAPEKSIETVLAAIRSIKRRAKKQAALSELMIYRKLLISPEFHQVFLENTEISLTRKEFDILCYLMENKGMTMTYTQILSEVWGIDNATPNVLATHIKMIRKKLSKVSPYYGDLIINIHGFGYRLSI